MTIKISESELARALSNIRTALQEIEIIFSTIEHKMKNQDQLELMKKEISKIEEEESKSGFYSNLHSAQKAIFQAHKLLSDEIQAGTGSKKYSLKSFK